MKTGICFIVVTVLMTLSLPQSINAQNRQSALPKCRDYCENLGWQRGGGKGIFSCMKQYSRDGKCRMKGQPLVQAPKPAPIKQKSKPAASRHLVRQLKTLQGQFANLKRSLATIDGSVALQNKTFDELFSRLIKITNVKDASALELELTRIKYEVGQLQMRTKEDSAKRAKLGQQLSALRGETKQKTAAINSDLVDLRRSFEALGDEIDAVIIEQKRYETQLKILDGRATSVERQLVELQQKAEQLAPAQKRLENDQVILKYRQDQIVRFLLDMRLDRDQLDDPKDWVSRVPTIPVQQQQFCRIMNRFKPEVEKARQTKNQIQENAVYLNRLKDLDALLPNGQFENWIVRVKEVKQAANGNAAVMLLPPCPVVIFGSDACHSNPSEIRGTIPLESSSFRELAQVAVDDFVVISGRFPIATRRRNDELPLPIYAQFQPGTHCSKYDGAKIHEVFVTEINYLARLR